MTEAMPFLRKLITFLWPPDIWEGAFFILASCIFPRYAL